MAKLEGYKIGGLLFIDYPIFLLTYRCNSSDSDGWRNESIRGRQTHERSEGENEAMLVVLHVTSVVLVTGTETETKRITRANRDYFLLLSLLITGWCWGSHNLSPFRSLMKLYVSLFLCLSYAYIQVCQIFFYSINPSLRLSSLAFYRAMHLVQSAVLLS